MGRKFRSSDINSSGSESSSRNRSRSRSRSKYGGRNKRYRRRERSSSRSSSESSRGSMRQGRSDHSTKYKQNPSRHYGRGRPAHYYSGQGRDRNLHVRGYNNFNDSNGGGCSRYMYNGEGSHEDAFPLPPVYVCPEASYPTQPPKLSFKRFILTQEDDINEKEGQERYREYLLEFNKDQNREFFLKHKDEDWFKCKYYPEEYEQRKEEMLKILKNRRDVFEKLRNMNLISSVSLDFSFADKLEQLLNTASSLMENGVESQETEQKTQSIFLRNISPSISLNEITSISNTFAGLIRLCVQDPEPEKHFYRRGWITFDGTADLAQICESLNTTRVRDCDMGAVVNRDLKQRVRVANGLSVHKTVAKQDIISASKIIRLLDAHWKLWEDKSEDNKDIVNGNPVLQNIKHFLVEEIEYEETLMENIYKVQNGSSCTIDIERDEELLKVLDRLLLYLRIVYSIDYYAAFEYKNEDLMPHRCGVLHVRGVYSRPNLTQVDVKGFQKMHETNLRCFLERKFVLSEAEMIELGLKNEEKEVEKCIEVNTKKLDENVYECLLSNKRFRGIEFVRKHILSKHQDKIDSLKKDIRYFNNFLNDPNRPSLPEHPSNHQPLAPLMPLPTSYGRHPPNGANFNAYPPHPRRGKPNAPVNSRSNAHSRPIISYHDYDAECTE